MSDTQTAETPPVDDERPLINVEPQKPAVPADAPDGIRVMVDDDDDGITTDAPVAVADRPENIPENFWNAKSGEVETDKLAQAYVDLRAKMDSGKRKAPKDGKYDFSAYPDIMGEDDDDELLGSFTAVLKDEGISQDGAEKLLTLWQETNGLIDEGAVKNHVEQKALLGRNGDKIIESTEKWLLKMQSSGVISDVELEALARSTGDARVVTALNKIRRSYNEMDVPSMTTAVETGAVDALELQSMMGKRCSMPRSNKPIKLNASWPALSENVMRKAQPP
jgi:hypothetical protein